MKRSTEQTRRNIADVVAAFTAAGHPDYARVDAIAACIGSSPNTVRRHAAINTAGIVTGLK